MTRIVLDASSWIAYFADESSATEIDNFIKNSECITLSITLSEVLSKVLKLGRDPKEAIVAIKNLSKIVPATEALAIDAAHIYFERRKTKTKFALSDAFIVALSREQNSKILTLDTDFTGLPNAIILKK